MHAETCIRFSMPLDIIGLPESFTVIENDPDNRRVTIQCNHTGRRMRLTADTLAVLMERSSDYSAEVRTAFWNPGPLHSSLPDQ